MSQEISRRDFVRTSAAATTAVAAGLSPTLTVRAGEGEAEDVKNIRSYNADMEDDAELKAAGAHVETAVRTVLKKGSPLTYDIVGEAKAAKMSECGTAIIEELNKLLG